MLKINFVFLNVLLASSAAFAGNGIERIKFVGEVDTQIAPALHQALVHRCVPAAANAYEIIAFKISEQESQIDQGQVDTAYDLKVHLVIDPKHPDHNQGPVDQSTPDIVVPVDVRIAKYGFSNPQVSNVEVLALSGPGCFTVK
jgi:hypothetical protein